MDHRRNDTGFSEVLRSVTFRLTLGGLDASPSIVVASEIDIWIGILCCSLENESIPKNKTQDTRAQSKMISLGLIGDLRAGGGVEYCPR